VAIFFVCGCGQDVRADEQAACGLTYCPACCRPVEVPSLPRANRQLGIRAGPPAEAAPAGLAPQETILLPDPNVGRAGYSLVPEPPDEAESLPEAHARQKARALLEQSEKDWKEERARARLWRREKYWFQCLLYPLRAAPLLGVLILLWLGAAWLAVIVLRERWEEGADSGFWLGVAGGPLLLLACYTGAFFHGVLCSSAQGDAGFVCRPGFGDGAAIAWGALVSLVSFLAGPVVPAGVALLFWLNSGELTAADWLILWELATLTVAGWALGLLAAHDGGVLYSAAAAGLVRRRGWRVLAVAIAGSAAVALFGVMALGLLEDPPEGVAVWLGLAGLAVGGLFTTVFLLRWLGLTYYYARKGRRAAEA
jgi:hypothetical protein